MDTNTNIKLKIRGRTVAVKVMDYDIDKLVTKHTGFKTFNDLVNAKGGYRPSIYLGGKTPSAQRELLFITLAYNKHMASSGSSLRVYKGDWAPVFYKEHPLLAGELAPIGLLSGKANMKH